ncbi:TetR/AcrR family transcriptional regulator [Iamia sp. SCSIO 61187]|uniref:TetR/AcrR family transcriptional regulator n=1 Tax=Iamia sp. SCSIO 61187 TaxID=2722752 RepID=UPI001C636E53|nr:TetR/AcrR family transcriptional regulator [Iamia sp. SCSIO 61187]QYG94903.1 TetR/AcrR family transcriptional regulator [Iamia sp. SCSIO 61187]
MADVAADGRTARRDRNRDAVIDAALDLFREDAAVPGLAVVAERSGVSARSVQRYFADMDALVRAAMARHIERVAPLLELEDPGLGPVEVRVARIVASRLLLHQTIAPMVRVALLRARSNPIIGERLVVGRRQLLDQVAAMFAPEFDALPAEPRADLLAALDVVLGFESVEHLRENRGLTDAEAARVLRRAAGALLRPE